MGIPAEKLTIRPLYADEVRCRVNQVGEKGFSLLLYKDAQGEINMLGNRLARKNHWDFQIKEKAASGTNTDGEQGNITTRIINEKGGEVND